MCQQVFSDDDFSAEDLADDFPHPVMMQVNDNAKINEMIDCFLICPLLFGVSF